jgi:hypothetical protein
MTAGYLYFLVFVHVQGVSVDVEHVLDWEYVCEHILSVHVMAG